MTADPKDSTHRCLFWDDKAESMLSMPGHLQEAWAQLTGCALTVDTYDNLGHAFTALRDNDYAFVIIDDFRPSPDSPPDMDAAKPPEVSEWVGLKRQARQRRSDVPIIVLSKVVSDRASLLEAGCVFMAKTELDHIAPIEHMAQRIESAFRLVKAEIPNALEVTDDGEQLSRAALDRIGRANLAGILRKYRQRIESAQVGWVAPGLSGAMVLNVQLRYGGDAQETEPALLKLSRDGERLESELGKYARAVHFKDPFLVRPQDSKILDFGGWHALKLPWVDNDGTFNSWLAKATDEQRAVQLVEGLVHNLAAANKGAPRRDGDSLTHLHQELTQHQRAHIQQGLAEVHALLDIPDIADRPPVDLQLLEEFLHDGRVPDVVVERLPSTSNVVLAHGDLHGGNLLVTESGLRLIDPAALDPRHPAVDLGRICVDLLLRGVDDGALAHSWGRLPIWIDAGEQLLAGNTLDDTEIGPAPRAALNALLAGAALARLGCEPWELRIALAIEFLRAAARQSLPGPKRLTAMVLADRAIRSVAVALPPTPAV